MWLSEGMTGNPASNRRRLTVAARYVFEGSGAQSGGRVRITAQLTGSSGDWRMHSTTYAILIQTLRQLRLSNKGLRSTVFNTY